MAPHSIPHQLGHLNYNPLKLGENVDKWHVDTLRIDYVMFVTDPNAGRRRRVPVFHGDQARSRRRCIAPGEKPCRPDRTIAPRLPGPGYAVLQQGNMVVHRATRPAARGRAHHHGQRLCAERSQRSPTTRASTSWLSRRSARTSRRRNMRATPRGSGGNGCRRSSTRSVYSADRAALAAELESGARPISRRQATRSADAARRARWSISATARFGSYHAQRR